MKNLKTFILLVVAFYLQNMLLIKFMSMFLRRLGVFYDDIIDYFINNYIIA
jgi:hypothetical protein